ncbi:LOW QUALITY PROTEIN: hypothetical protein Cgig2_000351 [Carnegiea gigantea]|uniref:Uncharacterized protein n=1 Tax=Carnegiea gigantea TaxID=171969 RepID=A0A9Q1QI13_9CARY|nr:LOW QUALITY PROTEIN: hypothetical protein Cgig2_000351 [Carnegiea gigantea]
MSVMIETITRHVSEQVQWAIEAANSARPLPHFGYVPTAGCEPSHWEREASRSNWGGRPYSGHHDRHTTTAVRQSDCPIQGETAKSTITSTPYATHSRRTAWQNRSLHSPSRGMKSVRYKSWLLFLEAMQRGPRIMVPTIMFGRKDASRFAFPHNDPLVVEMKIANAIVGWILIDFGSSVNIITWDCLKKLTHPGCDIVPLVHPILGLGGLKKKEKKRKEKKEEEEGRTRKKRGITHRPLHYPHNPHLQKPRHQHPRDYSPHPCSITLTRRRNKLHLLGVSALFLSPLALVNIVEHCWYRVASPSSLRHSTVALTPRANTSAIVTSSSALFLLFSMALSLGYHLLRSGIPSLKDHQPRPHLLCIKQKGSKNQTKRLTNTRATNTLRKILKDQKGHRSKEEPIQRFPLTKLAPPPLRALQRFYYLSHKFGDGSGLIVLPYIELEVAGRLPLFSRGLPEGLGTFPQPDSRRTKRKSYFQYFTFDFFSMAIRKLGLLLKQYHPKWPVSLGTFWTRESETMVESCAIKCYTFGRRLVHGRIHLGDYESVPCRHEGWESDCLDRPAGTSPTRERPFLLSTDFPEVEGPSCNEELVDALSEDECLNDLSEVEEDVPPKVELVIVEATWAPGFNELRAEQGLPCVPSANNSSGDLIRETEDTRDGGILAVRLHRSAWFKKRHLIGNLFGFPILILSRDACNCLTINKGPEARELRMAPSTWGSANPSGISTSFHRDGPLPKLRLPQFVTRMAHPSLKACPPQTHECRLQVISNKTAHNTQLYGIIQQHSVECRLDHLREFKVERYSLGLEQRKGIKRTCGSPPAPDEGFPHKIGHLPSVVKRRKCHNEGINA